MTKQTYLPYPPYPYPPPMPAGGCLERVLLEINYEIVRDGVRMYNLTLQLIVSDTTKP